MFLTPKHPSASLDAETWQNLQEQERSEQCHTLAEHWQCSSQQALQRLAQQLKLPYHPGSTIDIAEDPLQQLPLRLIHEYQCLPLKTDDDSLQLITSFPPNPHIDQWIYSVTGKFPHWHLGEPEAISNTIKNSFGVGADSLDASDFEGHQNEEEAEQEDQNAAIIRFVNEVVAGAVQDRATDIHFEPLKDSLQIRYRIDGQLIPIKVPDTLEKFQDAITSRLKIMAKLNISERRRPQDGRIHFKSETSDLDIRISTFPTMYGESVSLRLLNQKTQAITIDQTGMLPDDQQKVQAVLTRPHGIILVTGPTGSGKSTSLSAFIRLINEPERRILTVEDPVEYEVPGINQTQVKPEIGLTFASSLRHILRQDPDVIMIGEIRDKDTADIGVRAALTGHLVLSTLHTNDAAGAFTRLVDMDIEPFLVASSVELIIAQRLVRKLNLDNVTPDTISPSHLRNCLQNLHLDPDQSLTHIDKIIEPKITSGPSSQAYRGRVGIFEILRNQDSIHELILTRASAKVIRQQAIANGMRTIQECGWEQAKRQLTSLSEVMRFAEVGFEEEQ